MSHHQVAQQALIAKSYPEELLIDSIVVKETGDSRLKYRQEVEEIVHAKQGEFSPLDLKILEALRIRLELSSEEAFDIRNDVLSPYREYEKKLHEYRRVFIEAIRREPLLRNETRNGLKRLQDLLNLKNEDVATLESQILQKRKGTDENSILAMVSLVSIILLVGISSWIVVSFFNSMHPQPASQHSTTSQKLGV